MGPPEAVWRLLGFAMHGRSHAIHRLPVHLENAHSVVFPDSAARSSDAPMLLEETRQGAKQSKLMAFFAMNARAEQRRSRAQQHATLVDHPAASGCPARDVHPQSVLYADYPVHFRSVHRQKYCSTQRKMYRDFRFQFFILPFPPIPFCP